MISEKTSLNALMCKAVEQDIFPGAVLLCAKGDQILFHKAYGSANLFTSLEMTKETVFDLASLTKPFATALATAKLIADKKLDIHQPIGTFLDDVKNTSKSNITIDMLLRHTSGLPAHENYYEKISTDLPEPRKQIRAFLAKQNLHGTPGTRQIYSDIGYMFLSWIIETVSGQRLDTFLNQHFYQPMGLNLFFNDLKNQDSYQKKDKQFAATRNCPWRKFLLNGQVEDENAWVAGGIEGHAGLFGDALSVFRLCFNFLEIAQGKESVTLPYKILRDFFQKDDRFDMVAGFDTPSAEKSSAGKYFSSSSIGHLGFTGTSFWIDPLTSLIVVLLTNRVHPDRNREGIREFRPQLHDLAFQELV